MVKIIIRNVLIINISLNCLAQINCTGEMTVDVKENYLDETWESYEAQTVGCIKGFDPDAVTIKQTALGSRSDVKMVSTGFFRTELINGRWWFVDPEGFLYYNLGVVELSPGESQRQQEVLQKKFGSHEQWAYKTIAFLKSNGFNGSGAWSDVQLIRDMEFPFVYTLYYSFMKEYLKRYKKKFNIKAFSNSGWQGYSHDLIFVFHPEFEEFAEERAKGLTKYKNDKNLLGIFSDNEMPIVPDALDRHLTLLKKDDPGFIAAWSWFRGRKGSNVTLDNITDKDRDAFIEFYLDRYFSIVSKAIRENDPNHLYLGCRYNQEQEELISPGAFRAAGKYCDVVSINHYRKWEPDPELLNKWGKWSGKPYIVTEWYVKGADTKMQNKTGAGWIVKTQKDRGFFYQNFTLSLIQSPYCVGWHWYKYQDNDPQDATTDKSNKDSNKGIVNIFFEPYIEVLQEMKTINENIYELIDFVDAKQN